MGRYVMLVGIQESFVDYPNEICIMVFTRGCGWDCSGCYNKESLKHAEPLDMDYVKGYLEASRGLVDCVTISGGEPTEWPGLPVFVDWLHDRGYRIKLDTNGTHPKVLERVLPKLSVVAMDVKDDPNTPWRYNLVTGGRLVDIAQVKRSMRLLSDWYAEEPKSRHLIYRTTMFDDDIDTDAIELYLKMNDLGHSEYTVQRDVRNTDGKVME